jgi:hypothetical protein
MTVTLHLKPEIEAGLIAQAQLAGMTVEQYVLSMVEGIAVPSTYDVLSAVQRAEAFQAWSAAHHTTPPLSDYAVSRESMYDDREH